MKPAAYAFVAVLSGLLAAGVPALAQKPAAEIMLTEDDAAGGYTLVREIRAEAHQTAMFAKKSGREMVDDQLRQEAAKIGADAVVGIKYEKSNPMFSKKGFVAVGRAVKYSGSAAVAATTPAPVPAPAPPPPVMVSAPAVAAPAPGAVATFAQPAPAPAKTAVAVSATSAGLISLSEGDATAGRPHTVLGEVTAEVHQTAMFPKKSTRDLLDEKLRAEAARLGADAVVLVKYDTNNPMFSKKGSTAIGRAVKFTATPVVAPAVAAPVITAPVIAATTPAPVPAPAPVPPVMAAAPAAAPAAPVVAVAPAVAAVAAPVASAIALSEANVSRPYDVLGPVNAELNQAAVSLDKTGRQVLEESLRKQAADLGADAVILVRYAGATGAKGPTAIGVAVKYK